MRVALAALDMRDAHLGFSFPNIDVVSITGIGIHLNMDRKASATNQPQFYPNLIDFRFNLYIQEEASQDEDERVIACKQVLKDIESRDLNLVDVYKVFGQKFFELMMVCLTDSRDSAFKAVEEYAKSHSTRTQT